MTITEWLDGIDAQAKAATKAPWTANGDGIEAEDQDGNPVGIVCTDGGYYPPWGADKDFITASRTTVPQLTALLRQACGLLDTWQGRCPADAPAMADKDTFARFCSGCGSYRIAEYPLGGFSHAQHCSAVAAREFLAKDLGGDGG